MFTGCKSQPNEEVYISEYKDAWGNVGKYDISLPYIHCDSKSAKKLNQTIKNEYKDLVDSLDEAKEEGYTLPDTKVSYDVYTHSNLLSLVIKEEVETEYPRIRCIILILKRRSVFRIKSCIRNIKSVKKI